MVPTFGRGSGRTWLGAPWWHWPAALAALFAVLLVGTTAGLAGGGTSPGATALALMSLAGALLVLGGWTLTVAVYRFVRGFRPPHPETPPR